MYIAVFERVDLICQFKVGKDGIGAIFTGFINAIQIHDDIIKSMEEQMKLITILSKDYKKKARLFQNFSNSWVVMIPRLTTYNEYKEMKFLMSNYKDEYQAAIDRDNNIEIVRLELQKMRFDELKTINLSIELLEMQVDEAKQTRDYSLAKLKEQELILDKMKLSERRAAASITDDHIYADENHLPFSEVFPNVRGKC